LVPQIVSSLAMRVLGLAGIGGLRAKLNAIAATSEPGVTLTECRIWDKALPLNVVWARTQGAKTNPDARWYGATARIVASDYELILDAGLTESTSVAHATESGPKQPGSTSVGAAALTSTGTAGLSEADALFSVATRVKQFLAAPKPINEDGTRAFFIYRWLEALGYVGFDDIEHGSVVTSGDFPDYVLRSAGQPVIAVEAKKIGYPLGSKEAAQIVKLLKYGSVLGLRGVSSRMGSTSTFTTCLSPAFRRRIDWCSASTSLTGRSG
jgi:hypothetical protein